MKLALVFLFTVLQVHHGGWIYVGATPTSAEDPTGFEGEVVEQVHREAFSALIRLGDYLYYQKAKPQVVVDVYESAFQIRSIAAGALGASRGEELASADNFILYGLSLEALYNENALEKAIALLKEAKEIYPENQLIRYNLAVYLSRSSLLGAQQDALSEYNMILKANPMHAGSLYNRALILLHMEKFEAAAKSLEEGLPAILEEFGSAFFAYTPSLIRKIGQLLQGVPAQPSRAHNLRDFVEAAFPLIGYEDEALILEFGVASGETITAIAEHVAKHKPDQLVHGFDSFVGLPEAWAMDGVGEYSQDGVPPKDIVPDNVRFHVGWFNDTLPAFLEEHPGQPVAAVHIDADLYSSTKEVLDLLATRMQPGCTVRFDEYYILRASDARLAEKFDQYEARAWKEAMEEYGIDATPVGFHGQSVTFSVLKNPSFRSKGGDEDHQNPTNTSHKSLQEPDHVQTHSRDTSSFTSSTVRGGYLDMHE